MLCSSVFLSRADQLLFAEFEFFLLEAVLLFLAIEVAEHLGGLFLSTYHFMPVEGQWLLLARGMVEDGADL
jgi:hypothetical protein